MSHYPLYLWPEFVPNTFGMTPTVVRSDHEMIKVLPRLLRSSPMGRVAITIDDAEPNANNQVDCIPLADDDA